MNKKQEKNRTFQIDSGVLARLRHAFGAGRQFSEPVISDIYAKREAEELRQAELMASWQHFHPPFYYLVTEGERAMLAEYRRKPALVYLRGYFRQKVSSDEVKALAERLGWSKQRIRVMISNFDVNNKNLSLADLTKVLVFVDSHRNLKHLQRQQAAHDYMDSYLEAEHGQYFRLQRAADEDLGSQLDLIAWQDADHFDQVGFANHVEEGELSIEAAAQQEAAWLNGTNYFI